MSDRIHTMTANVVSVVTIPKGVAIDEVEVLTDGAADVCYRIGNAPEDMTDPTVDDTDDDIHYLPAAVSARVHRRSPQSRTVIKLISSGTPKIVVTGR